MVRKCNVRAFVGVKVLAQNNYVMYNCTYMYVYVYMYRAYVIKMYDFINENC